MRKTTLLPLIGIVAATLSVQATAKKAPADKFAIESQRLVYERDNAGIEVLYPQMEAIDSSVNALEESFNATVYGLMYRFSTDNLSRSILMPPVTDKRTLDHMILSAAAQAKTDGEEVTGDPFPYNYYTTWQTFSNDKVVSLFFDQFIYQGGAHGIKQATIVNFDPATGQAFDVRDHIRDTVRFMELARKAYMKENKLKDPVFKTQTGFFMELDQLPMPENIGFVAQGVLLFYNVYEIAPYSRGPVTIVIPYSAFRDGVIHPNFTAAGMKKSGYKEFEDKSTAATKIKK